MASFTDDPKALGKFNPYIQQQPVEQMIEVGRRRQAAHDEGVQKIQTQIDNIAGLDVVRDVDKAYLQSKLNQLGNNLRTVAAGDFSNFQMVNHVTGMTSQIARDKGIQNAVSSAAKYRKELSTMDQAEKEGKSSPANKWVFGMDSQQWLNSSDVNEAFTAKYQPYVDVNKKWMEVMKSLHSDLAEVDIPYERNNDGSVNYGKTAAAMQRISKESVSAAKISEALKASLSPVEMNQLSIDGRYTFRGHTPDDLVEMSRTKYSKQLGDNDARIRELTGLANLASSKPSLRKQALDSIEAVKAQSKDLQDQFAEEAQYIRTNPEAAKGSIYKNEAINTFATSNAWEHKKENLLTNPIKVQENWEKDYALNIDKFKLDIRKTNWGEKMDVAKLGIEKEKLNLQLKKLNLDMYGDTSNISVYGGASTNIQDPHTAMINDANNYDVSARNGIIEMVRGIKGVSSVQVKNALSLYQTGDPADAEAANKIIPAHMRRLANTIIDNQKNSKRIKMAINESVNEAENDPTVRATIAQMEARTKNLPPIVIKDGTGKVHTFTQKDITNFVSKQTGGGLFSSPGVRTPLTGREQMLANAVQQHSSLSDRIDQYKSVIHGGLDAVYERRQDLIKQSLLKKGSTYIPRESPIIFSSEHGAIARRYWEGVASSAVAVYRDKLNEGGAIGGHEKLSEDDAAEALKWVTSAKKDNIAYSRVEQGDNVYLQLKNEGKEILIPMSSDLVSQLPVDKGSPSHMTKAVTKAQYLGNGYTNPTGDIDDSYFTNVNMPRTTMKVGADIRKDNDTPGLNYIDFKLKTTAGIIPLTIEAPLDLDDAINIIQNMDDKTIKDAYMGSRSISPQLKKVISNQ